MIHSPFLVVEDFLSPLLCEHIVDGLDFIEPDVDKDGYPIVNSKNNEVYEKVIYSYISNNVELINDHFGVEYRGMKPVEFKWYPENYKGDTEFTCENAFYNKDGKWAKNKDRDITGIIFLSDYNDETPFESDYEVYGGKYEFAQHNFGFHARRGTLILYPSGPHFLNQTKAIAAGDLFLAKFHIATQLPFLYDPTQFSGNYTNWFESIS